MGYTHFTDDVPYEKEKIEMEHANIGMIGHLQSTPKKILGKIVMLEKTKRIPKNGDVYLDPDDLYDKTTYKRRPEITGNDIIKVAVTEKSFNKEYYCFSTVEDLVEKQNKPEEKPVFDKEVLDAMLPPIDKIQKANNQKSENLTPVEWLQDIRRYCPESFYRTISDDKFLEVINRGWIPNGWAVFDKNKHEAFMDQYGQVHTTGHGNKGYALILKRDNSKCVRANNIELDHKINKLNASFQELNKTLKSLGNELMEINEAKNK